MNEPDQITPPEHNLTISWVSYILHLVVAVGAVIPGAQFGPLLLVVALIIDLVKKQDLRGDWQASHFKYRIRSVIWAGVLYLVTLPLWLLLVLPGWLAWCAISIWFIYRIVLGMVRLHRLQPMPDASGLNSL